MSGEYVRVHLKMRKDLYSKLWEICKRRYEVPVKKFYIVVNEVLEAGLKREEEEG